MTNIIAFLEKGMISCVSISIRGLIKGTPIVSSNCIAIYYFDVRKRMHWKVLQTLRNGYQITFFLVYLVGFCGLFNNSPGVNWIWKLRMTKWRIYYWLSVIIDSSVSLVPKRPTFRRYLNCIHGLISVRKRKYRHLLFSTSISLCLVLLYYFSFVITDLCIVQNVDKLHTKTFRWRTCLLLR